MLFRSTPLCICTTAFLSIHLLMGHLGCFHVLAIINSAVRNHFTPVRMAAIQKSTSNKCWKGCGPNKWGCICGVRGCLLDTSSLADITQDPGGQREMGRGITYAQASPSLSSISSLPPRLLLGSTPGLIKGLTPRNLGIQIAF